MREVQSFVLGSPPLGRVTFGILIKIFFFKKSNIYNNDLACNIIRYMYNNIRIMRNCIIMRIYEITQNIFAFRHKF